LTRDVLTEASAYTYPGGNNDLHDPIEFNTTSLGDFSHDLTQSANASPFYADGRAFQNSSISLTDSTLQITSSGGFGLDANYTGQQYYGAATARSILDVHFTIDEQFNFHLDFASNASGSGYHAEGRVFATIEGGPTGYFVYQQYGFGREDYGVFTRSCDLNMTLQAGSYHFSLIADNDAGPHDYSAGSDTSSGSYTSNVTVRAVPEPSAILLLSAGAVFLLLARKRLTRMEVCK
jgi:hypothetical protein